MRKTSPKLEDSQDGWAERQKKNNRLGLVHHTRFVLKASEPQISGRMDGSQGQMAETENWFAVSEREAKASLQLLQKGGKKSVWMCAHRRGKNLPEGNISSQREETRVSSKKEIVGISGLGIVFPECIHSQVPGLVSEESSSCFRHWVIRYTQGNIPTAIKAWAST